MGDSEGADRRAYGREAEQAAVEYLGRSGYAILARNFACRYGELDIVAQKDGMVCFVEVRMRSTSVWGDPSLTVTRAKQRRVVKAALHYLFAHRLRDQMIRFDVMSVLGRGSSLAVEHIPNAFDAGM